MYLICLYIVVKLPKTLIIIIILLNENNNS